MAIEIIPEKKESSTIQKALLVAAVVFLALAIGSYFYFTVFAIPKKTAQLSETTSALAALNDNELSSKEAELRLAKTYIYDFKILYKNNPKTSGFFSAFQGWAHPKIVYSSFSLDVSSRKATMQGVTTSFQNVMQQIALLKNEPTIDSYEIGNVQMDQSGGVSFDLSVALKADIFK